MKLTKEQINKKYKDKYIEFGSSYDYTNQRWMYEIWRTSTTIKENMTLGQDVGTSLEYCR